MIVHQIFMRSTALSTRTRKLVLKWCFPWNVNCFWFTLNLDKISLYFSLYSRFLIGKGNSYICCCKYGVPNFQWWAAQLSWMSLLHVPAVIRAAPELKELQQHYSCMVTLLSNSSASFNSWGYPSIRNPFVSPSLETMASFSSSRTIPCIGKRGN